MKLTVPVNEFFGPTIQGEGLDVGKPCYFLRLHGCPVQCPGCDTSWTWDGSERGTVTHLEELASRIRAANVAHPRCGLVVSGGEPLIHYANENVLAFLDRIDVFLPWQSLETSGYVGKALTAAQCQRFFRRFDTVSFSPKVTPCLTGPKGEHEYDQNVAAILEALAGRERKTCVKLVVRDDHDLLAVAQFDDFFQVRKRGFQIHVMPYGQEPEEILAACRWLVPHLADMGYVLTPRLHSILWGKKRGV